MAKHAHKNSGHHPYQKRNGKLIHPNAPAFPSGAGSFRSASPFNHDPGRPPHPESPAARHLPAHEIKSPAPPTAVTIPSHPAPLMALATMGSKASFDELQNAIDYLTKKGKAGAPFTEDEKDFMKSIFQALWLGGQVKGYTEAGQLADNYVNGKVDPFEIDAEVYRTSVVVSKTAEAMKAYIRKHGKAASGTAKATLISSDPGFLRSGEAATLTRTLVNVESQGSFLHNGLLLAEQANARLKNANNRFFLQVEYVARNDNFVSTWMVDDHYDFEPFSKGYVTNIPLGKFTLKLPDGLSEYLTKVGVAKTFKYVAKWQETWK